MAANGKEAALAHRGLVLFKIKELVCQPSRIVERGKQLDDGFFVELGEVSGRVLHQEVLMAALLTNLVSVLPTTFWLSSAHLDAK